LMFAESNDGWWMLLPSSEGPGLGLPWICPHGAGWNWVILTQRVAEPVVGPGVQQPGLFLHKQGYPQMLGQTWGGDSRPLQSPDFIQGL
jgi:hypothetical protein